MNSENFTGLPTAAVGIFFMGVPFLPFKLTFVVLISLILIFSFLMVSRLNFYSLKPSINQNRRFVFQGVHMTLEGRPGSPWLKNEKRTNQIVFIGKDLDKDEINQGFNKCLHQSKQLV